MSRVCGICVHPRKDEIEAKIRAGTFTDAGLARTYNLSRKGIGNHKIKHMTFESKRQEVLEAEKDLNELNTLAVKMKKIEEIVQEVLENAKLENRDSVVLAAARELRAQVDLAVKASAEIRAQEEMRAKGSWKEEWETVKQILIHVFEKYPEAGKDFDRELFSRSIDQFEVS